MMNATTPAQMQANAAVDSRSDATAMRVYDCILRYKARHDGCSPSMREIARLAKISSTSMVSYYIDKLESMRMIRRSDDDEGFPHACSIEVVGAKWMPPGERA